MEQELEKILFEEIMLRKQIANDHELSQLDLIKKFENNPDILSLKENFNAEIFRIQHV